jgi:hypothetical protein
MSNELQSKHYVMTIQVERIEHWRKQNPRDRAIWEEERRKATVVSLALTAKELEKLLEKGTAHLQLVEDDGSAIASTYHEPGKRQI